ncbi:LCP family protein [Nonomuraea sp. NEAU-A123]|uniref:LCP family protein n=1 Tax=Nonomuraea sp. NEAU-A123 TaxID=2839649 RepID=UPI001BE49EFC|nr:LCP family protein [Nonomuraea sp. NEAU-A123]MBT2224596.1 LCP family protein [Nonomuraea sp. NEAU-A123]
MSDQWSVSVQDRRVASTQPGSRMSRRAAASSPPPPPPEDLPPRGHRGGGGGGGNKMRVLAWISIATTSLMVAGALTGYTLYRDAFSNINQRPVDKDIINPRPPETGALNVLLVGSDTRAGKGNAKYGQADARKADAGGKRTDTIILMHISPNRDQARLISFPRDSMVQIPKCKNETTKQEMPPRRDMINSAYSSGGVACTMSTLETLTGIRVDHFVEVDFSGFKNIVDALDGIEICLANGVDDKNSHLKLPAGKSVLNGEQALGYVRLRHYGDGSDIQRIKRQQIFLSKVVQKATSSQLLTDVGKLRDFIKATAKSVTMDPDLANDTSQLIEIATSAQKMTAGGVKFTTIPWQPDPDDKNRVIWRQPDANELFNAIKSDVDLPEPAASASTAASTPKINVKPEQVQVQVLNGTTTTGKAKEVADLLSKEGFKVTGVGNYLAADGKSQAATQVRYAKNAADGAAYSDVLIKAMQPKPAPTAGKLKPTTTQPYTSPVPVPSTTPATAKPPVIQLIIGEDFKSVKVTKLPDSVTNSTISADKQKNVCT